MLTARELEKLLPEFISHLVSSASSRSTIKNYGSDLRRVISKLDQYKELDSSDFSSALEELKKEFSESSIRRFGFSLKAFTSWLSQKGLPIKQADPVLSQKVSEPINQPPADSYISHLEEQGAHPKTVHHYSNDISNFFSWFRPGKTLSNLDHSTINKISSFDVKRYISFQKSKQVSEATINRQLYSLKSFFGNQKEKIVYETNPVQSVVGKPEVKKGFWNRFKLKKPRLWHAYRGHPISDYVNWAAMAVITLIIGLNVFGHFFVPSSTKIDVNQLKGLVLASTPPAILSFQGRLTNNVGAPVTSSSTIVFKIYDAETAGTLKWTSKDWEIVPDANGIFSSCLGDTTTTDDCLIDGVADTAFPANLFSDNPALYLEIVVEGETLTPRQRIAASSYALNSDTLDGIDSLSFLRSDTSDNFTSGTLTTDASTTLDVNGTLAWGGATVSEGLNNNDQLITNIGDSGTDFVSGGGLTLAGTLTANGIVALNNDTTISINSATAADDFILNVTYSGSANKAAQRVNYTNNSTATTDQLAVFTNVNGGSGATETLVQIQNLDDSTTTSGLLISSNNATGGTITNGINFFKGGAGSFTQEILLQNGETISNSADGIINFGTTTNLTASGAISLSSTTSSAATLDSGTTGNVNLGTGNNAKTIDIGTGTAGNTINIGTDNTTLDTINIGSALDDVAITGDQWSITNAGALTVQSCSGCGGGSQTPWTSNIDANGFDLLDFGDQLTARDTLTIASTGAGNDITINGADQFIVEDNTVFNTSIDATFLGTENFEITSDLDGSVNIISLITTPSSTSGSTRGIFIQQANSANSNGLDTGIFVQNSDTNLPISLGIDLSGLYTTGIKVGGTQDGSITTGITVGSNVAGEDITTGFKYTITGTDLTTSSTGADGFLIDLTCSSCSTNTTTLTNGFRLAADEDSTSVTNGILIEATNSGYIQNALKIGSLSSGTSSTSETAITVGGGWDTALSTPFGGFGNFGNFLDYSEDFNNAAWTKSNVTVGNNSTVAPDNTTTADTLTSTSSNGFVSNSQATLSALTGQTWTFSVWLKVSSTPVTSRLEIISSDGTPVTAASETVSVTTDWQRFHISGTFPTETDTSFVVKITPVDGGTGAIIAWGAQADAGLQPSIYTRTESSTFSFFNLTGASVDGYLRVGQNAMIGALSSSNTAYGLNLVPNLTPCVIFCGSVNTAGQEIAANVLSSSTNHASLHISNPTLTTGSITNNYGIYIDNQTVGTNDVGIFVASAQNIGVQVGTILGGSTGFQGGIVFNSTGTTTGVNIVGNAISSGTQNLYTATLVANTTGTANGIFIDLPASTSSGGTINGINIDSIGSSHANSTDTAIKIGTGWDYGLASAATKNGVGTQTPQEVFQVTATGDAAIQFEDLTSANAVGDGPKDPATMASDNSNGGSVAWTSPANAVSSNNSYATVTLGDLEESENLKATNFNFSIPTDAKVLGIKVEIERSESGAGQGYLGNIAYLQKGDLSQVGGLAMGDWTDTDTYETVGSSSALWNTTWTASDINDSDFGTMFSIICFSGLGTCGGGTAARVDHVRITVYYSLNWTLGIDSSDSGVFKLSRTSSLGINDAFSVDASSFTLEAQEDSTLHTFGATCACIVNTSSTAGSFNPNTSQDGVGSSVVYNGKLYISTKETNGASIYRYDGGTTWTQVSSATEGRVIDGDATDVDVIMLNVFNGLLWAGTQTAANTGAMYSYDGSTWTLRQATRGTFGAETLRDGVSDIHIYNGRLYISTQETNAAGVYRFDGNNTWTRINGTLGECTSTDATDVDGGPLVSYSGRLYWGTITGSTTGRVCMYDGATNAPNWPLINSTAGTFTSGTTAEPDVVSLTVFNGQLVVGTQRTNLANIYISRSTAPLVAGADAFYKTTTTSGRIDSTNDATDVDTIGSLKTYNGRLYAASITAASTGAIYEFNNCGQLTTNTNCWTLVNGARGTFGAQTGVDNVQTMVEFNGSLYVGTEESNAGSLYIFTKTSANSFYLNFNSGSNNYGSIYYTGSTQAQNNANHTGTFFFNSSINSTTGSFDLAEDYPTFDLSLEAGEIVSVDPTAKDYVKRAEAVDKKTSYIGIVSTDPGFKLSQRPELVGGDKYVPVALSGRVPVRVNSEGGPIEPGDLLTLSSMPGVAKKAKGSVYVIGKALEGYSNPDQSNVVSISVFINFTYSSFSGEEPLEALEKTAPIKLGSPSELATASAAFLDGDNFFFQLVDGAQFAWTDSTGKVAAFVTSTGESSFAKVTSLIGSFGKLIFGELLVKKDSQVAGEVTFAPGATEITVESDKVTESSLIYITPTSKTDGFTLYLKEKKPGQGFVVALQKSGQTSEASVSATTALKFNWLIVNKE